MNHHVRRWLLHDAVEQLEPDAHSAVIRDYIRQQRSLDLPLIRIYVDLERLVAEGYLLREKRSSSTTTTTTFFWETTGKVRVRSDRPTPKTSAAAAPLERFQQLPNAVAVSSVEMAYEVL